MNEKKDLLNNLKIDRTAPPSEEPMTPFSRYGILGAISVAIVIGWLFFHWRRASRSHYFYG